MCVETMQLSDIAHRKIRVSRHIVDELRDMSLDDRKTAMYKIFKSITPKLHLIRYYPLTGRYSGQIGALVINTTEKAVNNYCIVMYPWTAKRDDLIWSRSRVANLAEDSRNTRLKSQTRTRLKESTLVHISYKNIHTEAFEKKNYPHLHRLYEFANAWNESWGKIIKWEAAVPIESEYDPQRKYKITYQKKARYEFFVPNVTSKAELQDRLEKLQAWMNNNII